MSASDFDLPPALEALVLAECAVQGLPARSHDEIRALVSSPESSWPVCCRGSCNPCIDEHTSVARAILARWRARSG